jgi:hypothetical protein
VPLPRPVGGVPDIGGVGVIDLTAADDDEAAAVAAAAAAAAAARTPAAAAAAAAAAAGAAVKRAGAVRLLEAIYHDGFDFADGQGTFGDDVQSVLKDVLQLDEPPDAVQMRCFGAKGMLVHMPGTNGVGLRPSMIKFISGSCTLEVISAAKSESRGSPLIRQFIYLLEALGVRPETFARLQVRNSNETLWYWESCWIVSPRLPRCRNLNVSNRSNDRECVCACVMMWCVDAELPPADPTGTAAAS